MPNTTTTVTVRLEQGARERLEALAKSTRRSKSFLAAEAINAYLAEQDWQVEAIRKAVVRADSGGAFADQSVVEAWVATWGDDDEKPAPSCG